MYELHAVKYGELNARKRSDLFVGGDSHDGRIDMDYFVWAAIGDDRVCVIDTGFGPDVAAERGRRYIQSPAESLSILGVDAERVEDVVITHMHYDHAGNAALFPRARFHVQDAEMAWCTGRAMTQRHLAAPFEVEDVTTFVRRVFDGRVVFHAGDSELCAGVSLHHLPGHTPGLQAVRVDTARGPVVLASDVAHFWANLERAIPFPIVADVGAYLDSHRRLRALAPSLDHIIPGHDPLVLARFPAEPGTSDVVRLDLGPVHTNGATALAPPKPPGKARGVKFGDSK